MSSARIRAMLRAGFEKLSSTTSDAECDEIARRVDLEDARDITHACGHCSCTLYDDGSVCQAPASFCKRCGTPSGHLLCDKCQAYCWAIYDALPHQRRTAADKFD